ncbi:hypothetical protein PM8797T_09819 [Gimesia maris DSM 8797]|nr:hypothetical protein PM8797T_09819 [Gimesia maris DSM 8797]
MERGFNHVSLINCKTFEISRSTLAAVRAIQLLPRKTRNRTKIKNKGWYRMKFGTSAASRRSQLTHSKLIPFPT